ncbi:hypothetical protein JXA40_07250 [bacterium]|nr:hypothetical protein [candidate division CSSED10-310 bacterium]
MIFGKSRLGFPGLIVTALIRQAGAMDYLVSEPGTVLKYTGTMVIDGEKKDISKILRVLEPFRDAGSGEFRTVHEEIVTMREQEYRKVKYYQVRPDGIFLIAESEETGGDPVFFSEPLLWLKLPPETAVTWKSGIREKKKKISVDYEILDRADSLILHGETYRCVHIRGTGEAKVMGVQIPMKIEMWIHPDYGVIQEINHRVVGKSNSTTTFIIDPPQSRTRNSISGHSAGR